jgi:hypothetical protein
MQKGHPVFEAVDRGETLVKATKHPLLRHLHKSVIIRWCLAEKLTALKIGRSYFTTDSLVKDFLFPTKTIEPPIQDRHKAALDSIHQMVGRKGGDQ